MLAGPNLFSFATSELSQDAFIAWLLAWADPKYGESDGALHKAGISFLNQLIQVAGVVKKPTAVKKGELSRQYEKIDVLAIVNDEFAVIIEDKTNTAQHSGQLKRYRDALGPKYNDKIAAIYLKTGDQCDFHEVERENYGCMTRKHFIDILHAGLSAGVQNDVYRSFAEHLQNIEDEVESFASKLLEKWAEKQWIGFFKTLHRQLGGGNWCKVNNKRGGFWSFTWHHSDEKPLYLLLEQERLQFKIAETDRSRGTHSRGMWSEAVLSAAGRQGENVRRPEQFGLGKNMTVATLSSDYRQAGERAVLDLLRTIAILKQMERVADIAKID